MLYNVLSHITEIWTSTLPLSAHSHLTSSHISHALLPLQSCKSFLFHRLPISFSWLGWVCACFLYVYLVMVLHMCLYYQRLMGLKILQLSSFGAAGSQTIFCSKKRLPVLSSSEAFQQECLFFANKILFGWNMYNIDKC